MACLLWAPLFYSCFSVVFCIDPYSQGRGLEECPTFESLEMPSLVLFIKKKNDFSYVWMFCLHVCLCNICVLCAQRSQKRVLDTLGVELEIAVSCCVGAGTWTSRSSERAASVS